MSYADELQLLGFREPEELAIGMQGAVYRLGDGRIAKVWFHAQEPELRTLQELYDEIAGQLPYATPRILEVRRPEAHWVTIEEELPGVPLHTVAVPYGEPGWERARDCVVEVVASLSQVQAPKVRMAVLDETDPFRPADLSWVEAITGLVRRRLERYGHQLAPVIDDFDTKISTLLKLLEGMTESEPRLVHGDVTSGNILVDEQLRPVSLLDFGLLTMAGDPAFEAAATATVIDLWSPRAREIEAAYDSAFVTRLGYDAVQLLVYRCAYSLIIANAHEDDPYGRDSHVPLTAKFFNTSEVTALLTR